MKIELRTLILCLVGWSLSSPAAVIWGEDFSGATLSDTSGNNEALAGTVIETANAASCIVVDSSTDPAAAEAFTLASGNFIRLSVESNNYAAVRSVANPITFPAVDDTDTVTMTADIYLPSNTVLPVFKFNPRLETSGAAGNGATFGDSAVTATGQYTITYTDTVANFKNPNSTGDADTAYPFLFIEQLDGTSFGAVAAADFMYMDNIRLEIVSPADPLPPLNSAYFSALKAGTVFSTPLVKWQQFGPGMSGYIDKFWINNGDPNAMYTQLDMGNGHVTLNRGEYWTSYKEIDGNGLPGGVTGIEFSYQDPDFGLMMAKEGIYKTTNRGRSWDFLVDIFPNPNSQMNSVMTVDPNNDNVWYIGAGQHWMIKDTHFTKNGLYYSSDGNYSAGFILKSTNKGQAWTKVLFPNGDEDFSKIIVDPRDSDVVYASTQYGVHKSEDGGMSWALVEGHAQLPHNQPRDMGFYYDGANEFLLYVLEVTHYTPNGNTIDTSGGVYRSSDGGTNWVNLTGNLGIDMSVIGPSSYGYREKYFWAIGKWLEESTEYAKTNFPAFPANTFSQFTRIAVDPTDKDRIYLSHNYKHDYAFPPGNIWMTDNGGANWIAAAREGPYWINEVNKSYWQSRGQPMGMNANFAHVDREHRENDNTQSGPRFVFCNPLGEVYTCFAQQVMRSTDYGVTWNQVDDDETAPGSGHWVGRGDCNLPGETFCLDTGTPGTYLWGCGEHGLWRNTDDGDLVYPGAIAVEQLTGQSISDNSPLSISTIATAPQNPDHVYMIPFRQNMKGELLFSADGGDAWTTLSTPISFPNGNDVLDSRSLLIDHQNTNNIYFCIPFSEWERWSGNFVNNGRKFDGDTEDFGQGIYKSTDGGGSFSMITNGIPANRSVYRMAMDPFNPLILYAALNETHNNDPGGLYKTTNGGASWSAVTIPSGIRSVNDVVAHPNGYIYIACGDYNGSTGGGYISQDGGLTWHLLFDMPYLRHFSPSLADPDIITVNVDKNTTVGQRNPGLYVTIDGGANWFKINSSHGQPDGIRKVEPDPYDKNVLWMSNHGTGFFRADISPLFTGEPNEPLYWDWMEDYGQTDRLADTDEDGFDANQEYIAGTDPSITESFFRVDLAPNEGSAGRLVFDSVLNRLYSVDMTDDLLSGWTEFTNGVSGTGDPLEISDSEIFSNRFYRINVEME
ncbi:beta propeller repeat protein [Pontiella sulfatireligans]|uniref:Xyloglucanase Xgh74A n=1 Tax=Pontiella sulfatireligans TaxID=2750658 RepID=A0A6C2UQD9_9BACT|nr:hypothetical protein [Pontiella sulfatireligans]VGO22289.1 Xyloglucanase Xgh74A [Pontiella sulfatireligans]